jgi:hypothetical protein
MAKQAVSVYERRRKDKPPSAVASTYDEALPYATQIGRGREDTYRRLIRELGGDKGRSREGPPVESDEEEACDERSWPQDVTSADVRPGGVNLQQEVEPHQTERPPRDSSEEDTPDMTSGVKCNIQPDRGRHHGFARVNVFAVGIDSPRGQRWYHFDPRTFLECATAGSYGGWQPGDETGRDYVPGPVAVMADDGGFFRGEPPVAGNAFHGRCRLGTS